MPELVTTRVLALLSLKGFGKEAIIESLKEGMCVWGYLEKSSVSAVYIQAKDHHARRNQETIHSDMTIFPFCNVLLGLFIGKTQLQARNKGTYLM